MLAQHRVEAAVRRVNRRRRAGQELDPGRPGACRPCGRQGQHRLADITGHHPPARTHGRRGQPGYRTWAAGHVQHRPARLQILAPDQFRAPRLEQLTQHEPLITVGDRNLHETLTPRTLYRHLIPPAGDLPVPGTTPTRLRRPHCLSSILP